MPIRSWGSNASKRLFVSGCALRALGRPYALEDWRIGPTLAELAASTYATIAGFYGRRWSCKRASDVMTEGLIPTRNKRTRPLKDTPMRFFGGC